MAVDEALMESVREGGTPVLRFYRWEPRCLSFGRNQPAVGWYDRERIAALGLDVVRRPTGGRAVVHARELTYAVVVRDHSLGGPRESYRSINRALAAGLRRLGLDARIHASAVARAAVPSTNPCFEEPAEGEVVVADRKLVGSAQWRRAGVLLQHGSLLLADDQQLLASVTRNGQPAGLPPATLAEHLAELPDWTTLTAALLAGWTEVLGADLQPSELSSKELARVRELVAKHSDPEWIWRS